jgi:hypothetical protein
MNEDMEERLRAVERLVQVFRLERFAYLVVTGLALLLMFASAVVLLTRGELTVPTLTLLFGSSGLISYSIGRLLKMWDQAIALVSREAQQDNAHG